MSDAEIREQLGGRRTSEELEESNTNIENQIVPGSEDANDHEEEARDTVGNLPLFSPRLIERRQSDGGEQLKQIRGVTPPPPSPQVQSAPQPTPVKNSSSNAVRNEKGSVMSDKVEEYLRSALAGQVQRNLEIIDFIHLVYDFTPDSVPRRVYSLPEDECRKFCEAKTEPLSYKHLEKIFDSLKSQVFGDTTASGGASGGGTPAGGSHDVMNLRLGALKEKVPTSSYGRWKPDFFLSSRMVNASDRESWTKGLAYGEVKRSHSAKLEYKGSNIDLDVLFKEYANSKKSRTKRKAELSSSSDSSGPSSKRARVDVGERRDNPTLSTSREPLSNGAGKRKVSRDDAVQDEPASKRVRSNGTAGDGQKEARADEFLLDKEPQSARYMMEMLSHGIRSYATGWMLSDTKVTLWYGDRMGVVLSKPFDIFLEAHYLVLLLTALFSSNLNDFGISSFVKTTPSRFVGYEDLAFELEQARLDNDTLAPKLTFKITDAQRLRTDYGIIGRGTTIIPVQAVDQTVLDLELGGDGKNSQLVAKIAWPLKDRIPEADFVKAVRQGLRKSEKTDMLKHVVDVKCSLERTIEEIDLPRVFMDLEESTGFDRRELRCLVMPRYERLEDVCNVDEFKKIFLDTIRAHHMIYKSSGILHRDISVGNVMFYREQDTVIGVLCDWDLALDPRRPTREPMRVIEEPKESERDSKKDGIDDKKASAEDDEELKRPRYRTGTGPFMAYELLRAGPVPPHIYRYDLESFFWLLAWFCAVFNPKTHVVAHKSAWDHPDLFTVGQKKHAFMDTSETFEKAFKDTDSSYRDLVDTWVTNLRDYVAEADNLPAQINTARLKLRRLTNKKDSKQADEARRDLEALEKKKPDIMTYEGFMEIINEDP